EAYAKALLVERASLAEARKAGDVLGAYRILLDAYATDVRPLCARVRENLGGAADPISAFKQSGYAEKVAEARAEGAGGGSGESISALQHFSRSALQQERKADLLTR